VDAFHTRFTRLSLKTSRRKANVTTILQRRDWLALTSLILFPSGHSHGSNFTAAVMKIFS
jgi:hypothetical protein